MNRQIQCLVGHQTFQSPVFLLQLLEAPSLIHLHTTGLLPPPVVGLFADAKLTNGLSDRFALTGPYLCLTKVSDNLLCGVTLSRHDPPFLMTQFLTTELGTIQGGRSGEELTIFH